MWVDQYTTALAQMPRKINHIRNFMDPFSVNPDGCVYNILFTKTLLKEIFIYGIKNCCIQTRCAESAF